MVSDTRYTDRVMKRVVEKGIIKDICESYRGETRLSSYKLVPVVPFFTLTWYRRTPTEANGYRRGNG